MSIKNESKIIEIAIDDTGTKPPELSVIEQWIIDDAGITSIRNVIQGWLVVVTSPKAEREAVSRTVGEYLKSL
jgi:hypothetical protein